MGYSRKIQTGQAEDIVFPAGGIEERACRISRSIKKEVEFPGEIKKKSCGISMGLGFWCWNFQGL